MSPEPLKIPGLIDCEKGDLILPGLLGIMMGPIGLGNRFQPTIVFHEMGKRGILNGSPEQRAKTENHEMAAASQLRSSNTNVQLNVRLKCQ